MSGSSVPKRFVALYDIHWGYERKGGHKTPIHNPKALKAVLEFLREFRPDVLIWGGDVLDLGAISHHNKNNRRAVEGLRILEDAQEAKLWMQKARSTLTEQGHEVFIKGNHEDWLEDILNEYPGLEGVLRVESLLDLHKVKIVEQGGSFKLGKLWFIHGDQFRGGGTNVAKKAVEIYGRNVRLGHFHKFEAFSKHSAVDDRDVKTGIAIPCLCTRGPKYLESAPNQWSNGFLFGYMNPDGTFTDYVPIIVNGRFNALGRTFGAA